MADITIIVQAEKGDRIQKLISSLTRDTKTDLQMIVVQGKERSSEPGHDEKLKSMAFLEHITVKSELPWDIYNEIRENVKGKRLWFLKETDNVGCGAADRIADLFSAKKIKACAIKPVFFSDKIWVPYTMCPVEEEVIDLKKTISRLPLYFNAVIWDRGCFEKEAGGAVSGEFEKVHDFMLRYFSKNTKFGYLKDVMLRYAQISDDDRYCPFSSEVKWYISDLEKVLLPWTKRAAEMEGFASTCYYSTLLNLLEFRFIPNIDGLYKQALSEKELERFFELTDQIVSLIPDDQLLLGRRGVSCSRQFRYYMLSRKYDRLGKKIELLYANHTLFIEDKSTHDPARLLTAVHVENDPLIVDCINYDKGCLIFDVSTHLSRHLSPDRFSISAAINEQDVEGRRNYASGDKKYFGKVIETKTRYQFVIPVTEEKTDIKFYVNILNTRVRIPLRFDDMDSRLCPEFSHNYWQFTKGRYLFITEGGTLLVRSIDSLHLFMRERQLQKEMADTAGLMPDEIEMRMKGIELRKKYFAHLKKYENKHIWIMSDKLYKGGDNGEYMYHYLRKNRPDIDAYYIINKSSADHERLTKDGDDHIICSDSDECRLLSLYAEAILATHAEVWKRQGFTQDYPYCRDLHRAKIVCIQHGLTIQAIAHKQNRIKTNTHLYCLASPMERENILKPEYDYFPENIAMTGLARYDGLKDKAEKQILICPTWRTNIVSRPEVFHSRQYNERFTQTDYYKLYNSLIMDERLIKEAKEKGYKIVFLLHPLLSDQKEDFKETDTVTIMQASDKMSYEKILTESALMVTDYSGIQFDFAYMKKPLVYFHSPLLPPQYEESVYEYKTMAFGPICSEVEPLVDEIIKVLERNCRMEDKYRKRVDDFFSFSDHSSCERIYKAVEDMLSENK